MCWVDSLALQKWSVKTDKPGQSFRHWFSIGLRAGYGGGPPLLTSKFAIVYHFLVDNSATCNYVSTVVKLEDWWPYLHGIKSTPQTIKVQVWVWMWIPEPPLFLKSWIQPWAVSIAWTTTATAWLPSWVYFLSWFAVHHVSAIVGGLVGGGFLILLFWVSLHLCCLHCLHYAQVKGTKGSCWRHTHIPSPCCHGYGNQSQWSAKIDCVYKLMWQLMVEIETVHKFCFLINEFLCRIIRSYAASSHTKEKEMLYR